MEEIINFSVSGAISGATIIAIVELVKARMKQKREISPQPMMVKMEEEFVLRREFNDHVCGNEKNFENVYGRMTEKDKEVAAVRAESKMMSKQLDRIEDKIDRMSGGKSNG